MSKVSIALVLVLAAVASANPVVMWGKALHGNGEWQKREKKKAQRLASRLLELLLWPKRWFR